MFFKQINKFRMKKLIPLINYLFHFIILLFIYFLTISGHTLERNRSNALNVRKTLLPEGLLIFISRHMEGLSKYIL